MSGSSFFDNPSWFKASDQDRKLVTDDEFKTVIGGTDAYVKSSDQGKANLRLAYQQLVEERAAQSIHNPTTTEGKVAQEKTNNQGLLPNMWDKISRSHEQGVDLIKGTTSVNLDGTVNKDAGAWMSKYLQKQQAAPKTYEEKKLDADMTKRINEFNHGGSAEKLNAILGGIGDILTNPEGLLYLGANSAATLTAAFLSGKAGGLVGGTAGPVGAAVGTTVGTITGVAAHSGALKYMEKIQESLDAEKIPYTPANIQTWMENNPDVIKEHRDTSLKYGGTMGVVSAATSFLGGKAATTAERAALRQAATTVEAPAVKAAISASAQQSGRTVAEVTKSEINAIARETLNQQTFKSKLGQAASNYGIQTVSEPIEEAAALAVAGEEITAKELIMETLGGIGGGPYGAVVDKSLYGTNVVADKTKNFAQKLLASTPESRAAAAEQKAEIKAAKIQKQAPADVNFEKDVAATDVNDPKVDEWADPKHASYDPIKAVTVLAKVEDPDVDLVDKARAVQNNFRDSIFELNEQKNALTAEYNKLGKNNDSSYLHIKDKMDNIQAIIDQKKVTYQQVSVQVSKIKDRAAWAAQSKTITSINPETATPDEITEHIVTSLGSSNNKNTVTNDGIATLMKRTDISDEQRTMLGALTAANVARTNVNKRATNSKSIEDVSNDIYNGMAGSDFKGIDAYRQGIMQYLTANNEAKATEQLTGLTKFSMKHQEKADAVADIYNTIVAKGEEGLSSKQQDTRKELIKNGTVQWLNSKSGSMVANIAQEATALQAEVKFAESLMAVHKNKGKGTASSVTNSPATANPTSSVVESAPVTSAVPKVAVPTPVVTKSVVTADLDIDYSELSDEALQRFVDKAETVGVDKLTPDQATKLKAVNKEIAQRQEHNLYIEDTEINDSTQETIPASLSENLSSSLDELTVNYQNSTGNNIEQSYAEAIKSIDEEINEAEAILNCFSK